MKFLRGGLLLAAILVWGSAQAGLANYGVLVGTPVFHDLEPPAGEGRWPHYVVLVDTPEGRYRAVMNVFSRADEQVLHREVALSPFGDYRGVFGKAPGFHPLPFNTASGAASGGALDFLRHPALLADIRNTPWDTSAPVVGGDVPVFDTLMAGARRVYIFGERWVNGSDKGVHDVHQNQGNFAGSFSHLNGPWQDGALVIEYDPTPIWIPRRCGFVPPCWGGYYWYFPNRTLVMTRFRAQQDFTNATGLGLVPTTFSAPAGSAPANGTVDYGPFLAGQFELSLTPTAGNPDVYIQTGSAASETSYRTRSVNASGREFIRDNPGAWTYVRVKANGAAANWSLTVRYIAP